MPLPSASGIGLLLALASPSGFEHAAASSTAEGPYEASRVLDRDPTTAWCEGRSDEGLGETLSLRLAAPVEARSLLVRAGQQKTPAHFQAQPAPKTLEIAVKHEDGTTLRTSRATLERKPGFQWIPLDVEGGAAIELRIVDVHPGARGRDTCIADVLASASPPAPPPPKTAPPPPIAGQRVRVQEHWKELSDVELASALRPDLYALALAARQVDAFQAACVGEAPRRVQAEAPPEPPMAPMVYDALSLDAARWFHREAVALAPAEPAAEDAALLPAGEGPPARILVDAGDRRVCYVYDGSGRLSGAVSGNEAGTSRMVVDLHGGRGVVARVDRYLARAHDEHLSTWSRTTFSLSAGGRRRR